MQVQEKSYIDKLQSYRLYSEERITEPPVDDSYFSQQKYQARLYESSALTEEIKGNIEQALRDYLQSTFMVSVVSSRTEAQNNIGRLLYLYGDKVSADLAKLDALYYFKEALLFKQSRQSSSFDKDVVVKILNNRGNYFQERLKDYKKAEEDYNEAIELDPYLAETYYNRGICYYRQKKAWDKRWQKDFNKAYELNKNLKWIDIGNE